MISRRRILLAFAIITSFSFLAFLSSTPALRIPLGIFHTAKDESKALVIASTSWEDTSWVRATLPDWETAIYIANDPNAPLHTSINKGREANVYLTYIVDNYHNLSATTVFLHGHQRHEHGSRDLQNASSIDTTPIDFDNAVSVKSLNIDFVQESGYANLRCILSPGCPAEIQPFRGEEHPDPLRPQEKAMAGAWVELFNSTKVPQVIATPCCAQFAVSREQIQKRPKSDYERFLKWLIDTPLDDFTSGRVFEYLWHVIFGRDPVYCPEPHQCYLDVYGEDVPNATPSGNNTDK